jgi:hypothetical protein
MKYLEENNILPKSQYGYRNNLETEDLWIFIKILTVILTYFLRS